jgi:hypothetical protein
VECLAPPEPGSGEALAVVLATEADLRDAIAAGRLRHVLALSALSRVFPLWPLPRSPRGGHRVGLENQRLNG